MPLNQNASCPFNYNLLSREGSYNQVFKSSTKHLYIDKIGLSHYGFFVHKKPKDISNELSNPKRAIFIWRKINPDLPCKKTINGWITPFIEGQQASDIEIALELVSIYQRSRYIILDACSPKNFIKRDDRVICVDVDAAYISGGLMAKEFIESWAKDYQQFWRIYQNTYPITIQIIKNLLYLDCQLNTHTISNQYLNYQTISYLSSLRLQNFPLRLRHLRYIYGEAQHRQQMLHNNLPIISGEDTTLGAYIQNQYQIKQGLQ